MIFDNIKNCEIYFALNPNFRCAFEFLKKGDFAFGKNVIDGKKIYANIEEYKTKPENEGRLEAHRKYVDIQYIAEGEEKIGFINIDDTECDIPYVDDVVFLRTDNKINFITLKKGDFVIFYPRDAHMPCLTSKEQIDVKKAVVKILL